MNLLHATCDTCKFGWAGPAFKDFIIHDGALVQLGFRMGKAVGAADVRRFLPKLCMTCGEVTFVYEASSNGEITRSIDSAKEEYVLIGNCCSKCGNTVLFTIANTGLFSNRLQCPKCKTGKLRVERSIAV